jgi:GTP-binding protein
VLDLKLVAEVGIVGYPNVGKSTLLAAISAAHPRIGDYPFTTIVPNLGVVQVRGVRFVAVDIPGLIEGAHQGKGLGLDFLRHVERTRLLVHLLDGASRTIIGNFRRLNQELSWYNPGVASRPQVVAVNKVDLPEVRERLDSLRSRCRRSGVNAYFISAATGEGVGELLEAVAEALKQARRERGVVVPQPHVFQPKPKEPAVSVMNRGGVFVVNGERVQRLSRLIDVDNHEVQRYLRHRLTQGGTRRALERAGIRPGDKVRVGEYEITW